MSGFLQNLSFDQISFWVGFVAGALGLWLISKLIPALPGLREGIRNRSVRTRSRLTSSNAERFRQETLFHVQGLHLASPLFSLDEIMVEPQILASPAVVEPGGEDLPTDILSLTIPYLPDWPELASRYSAKTISLGEALRGGANLILMGHPGSGKTVTLAYLICQIVRRDDKIPELAGMLPIYIHVTNLHQDDQSSKGPLELIRTAVHSYADSWSANRLESVLGQALQTGRALVLVDGLDEVSPSIHQDVVSFLNELTQSYPKARLVVSSTPDNFSGLTEMGLIPVAMASWNEHIYFKFVRKWSRNWYRFIRPTIPEEIEQVDPRLLNAWLLADNPVISPFDATMKVWAAFAGDTLGPSYVEAIESYIWRLTHHLAKSRPGLEDFALQMVASLEIALDLRRARSWKAEFDADVPESDSQQTTTQKIQLRRGKKTTRKLPGVLPELLESGILVERTAGRLAFSHPLIMAYLASAALAEAPISHFLSSQPDWTGKILTMLFMAATKEISPEISELLSQDDDPLLRNHLMIGRWLRFIPQSAPWRTQAMRVIAAQLQRNNFALGLRARLLSALLLSGDQGVSVLLRQISHTSDIQLQQISALGMGFLLDSKALSRLQELLADPEPTIFHAACLALVRIGNQQAFEILGTSLLNGSEEIRRSVAEALALDPKEGHAILKEASQMEDLLVRRSAVYGLTQISEPWSIEILEKLAVDDQQWVVRAAATQAIEEKETIDPVIPRPFQPLHEIPWLIAFAGEQGMGIAPGKPAQNLLLSALGEGSSEQQLAALNYLKLNPNNEALPLIYELLEQGSDDLQEAAFNTLWHNASAGVDITASTSPSMV